jgi:hypothetical protein
LLSKTVYQNGICGSISLDVQALLVWNNLEKLKQRVWHVKSAETNTTSASHVGKKLKKESLACLISKKQTPSW